MASLLRRFNWWRPVSISRWLHHDKNYGKTAYSFSCRKTNLVTLSGSLYKSLRLIPSGHAVPLRSSQSTLDTRSISPYRIFYNLYKPSTPFKKSSPPAPDFQIVVVKYVDPIRVSFTLSILITISARTTPMPTIQELTDLFDILPETPLPPPRQRRPQATEAPSNNPPAPAQAVSRPPAEQSITSAPLKSPTLFQKLFPWLRPVQSSPQTPGRKPNPFMALKTGKKIIVIAAVDAGNISFFRFGQGEFTEWPMM